MYENEILVFKSYISLQNYTFLFADFLNRN